MTLTFSLFSYILLQANSSDIFQLDFFSKLLGVTFTIGGAVSAWVLVKVKAQIGVLKNDFTIKFSQLELYIEQRLNKEREISERKLRDETDRLQRDIELKVATKKDLDSIKETTKLQFDNLLLQLKLLERQNNEVQ